MQERPGVGALFKKTASCLRMARCISQSNSILSAILAVMHPELHDTGQETMNRLRQDTDIHPQDVLHRRTSAFNDVSVIFNCITPPHQDGNTRKQWYDLLVSIGNYRNCNLELLRARPKVEYGPGTVVGLLGSTLEHAVLHFEGESVCYAYFMRDSVHQWAGIPAHSWMVTQHCQ